MDDDMKPLSYYAVTEGSEVTMQEVGEGLRTCFADIDTSSLLRAETPDCLRVTV